MPPPTLAPHRRRLPLAPVIQRMIDALAKRALHDNATPADWGAWAAIAAHAEGTADAHDHAHDHAATTELRAQRAVLNELAATNTPWTPDAIGDAYERFLHQSDHHNRRRAGAFYTPPALGAALAALVFDPSAPSNFKPSNSKPTNTAPIVRVLDPACGTGTLLIHAANAALQSLDARATTRAIHLIGVDIDPAAVAIARTRVGAAIARANLPHSATLHVDIYHADALDLATTWGQIVPHFGAYTHVVANPPFGNAIEARTARSDQERAQHARAFPYAATGAYDLAGLFVELAIRALDLGGRAGVIVPRALLDAPYAARLRARCAELAPLRGIVACERGDVFHQASVHIAGVVLERTPLGQTPPHDDAPIPVWTVDPTDPLAPAQKDGAYEHNPPRYHARVFDQRWGSILAAESAVLAAVHPGWPTLGAWTEIRASAATGEAYEWRASVFDHATDSPPTHASRLVTTGLIEPGYTMWGTKTATYLGLKLARPWVPHAAMSPRRVAQHARPRVLVAGLSRVLEAFVDAEGNYVGAVASLTVTPKARALDGAAGTARDAGDDAAGDNAEADSAAAYAHRLAAILCSAFCRAQFRARWSSQAMTGGSTPVTKDKLASLQLPDALLAPSPHRDVSAAAQAAIDRAMDGLEQSPLHALPDRALCRKIANAGRTLQTIAPADRLAALSTPAVVWLGDGTADGTAEDAARGARIWLTRADVLVASFVADAYDALAHAPRELK